jgi:uncharacterized membrane protein
MLFTSTVEIDRDPAAVFAVYTDVEGWPRWTRSVTSVRLLTPGPLQVGSRAVVEQPRLPRAEWTVTDLVPGQSFAWQATGPGVRTVGRHIVRARPGGCSATAELEQSGPGGVLIGMLTARLTRRYLEMETSGLKLFCELEQPG